jgi:hypothetical protein
MFSCTNSPIAALLERLKMPRPSSSSGTGKSASLPPSTPTRTKNESESSSPMANKSPRNPENTHWAQVQQRRVFLHHLSQWSLSHESSLHFQGKISLLPLGVIASNSPELGKTVNCILTDSGFTDARQKIAIKLFSPREYTKYDGAHEDQYARRDSMDPSVYAKLNRLSLVDSKDVRGKAEQAFAEKARGHYVLVVRCGAGWISAREYFGKLYCSHMESRQTTQKDRLELDAYFAKRSQALGPAPSEQDSVTIHPLFPSFGKLPPEIQEMIFIRAAGLSRAYNLRSDDYGTLSVKKDPTRTPISLSTMFRISKSMNQHLVPFIHHSTDFHFGLTGYASPIVSFRSPLTLTLASQTSFGNPAPAIVASSAA